ncbi:unnamed protein product [Paramecium sonneborni]|uniref:Uncharacterized protein n=1 Tax=Paramecium sonneborni TaxID=65129 RepID=A0A8S1R635_9CILI|nr:unnamed protein product [Paramecium sonneborni]
MLTIQNLDTEEIIGEKYILLKKKFQALELFLKFMKEIMNRKSDQSSSNFAIRDKRLII